MKSNQSFSMVFSVDKSPEEVFSAINDVRGWWTADPGIVGSADKLGDEFTYRYGDIHESTQRVTEWIPGKKVVWLVTEARLDFTKDKAEWKGTKIVFELDGKDGKTEVRFTHLGLVPEFECFDACSSGWGTYIGGSLRSFIVEGKCQPILVM
jgi:Activator of Hsp90 ATPase homolog 1-like protein